MGKLFAVAGNAFRETVRAPAFHVIIAAFSVFILMSPAIMLFALGEEMRMIVDVAMGSILLQGLFIALLSASSVLADEIEAKTTLSVLSKPVSKPLFILGKYIGVFSCVSISVITTYITMISVVLLWGEGESWTSVISMCVPAVVILAGTFISSRFLKWTLEVSFTLGGVLPGGVIMFLLLSQSKPDAAAMWFFPLLQGLILILMQLAVVAAVALALATRVSLAVNALISAAFFMLGHMLPSLVDAYGEGPSGSRAAFYYIVPLPKLANFNFTGVLAGGATLDAGLLGWCLVYCLGMVAVLYLVALGLFNTREIA